LGEQRVDRAVPEFGGESQITAENIAEVVGVLLPERAVQVVPGEELFLDGLGDLPFAGERTSRGDSQQQESDRKHAAQNAGDREEASEKEGKHGAPE
jgi:hypothetical protein